VQVVRGVLGHVERAEGGEEHVHLGRRFRVRHELKDDLDAVDDLRFHRRRHQSRGRDERHGAARRGLADAGVHLAARAAGQGGAELELRAPYHRGAGQHVLRHHLLHEPVGRPDVHAAVRHVGLVHHAAHAAVVVHVAVRVDHRAHRPLAAVPRVEGQAGGGHLGGDERVDHDEPAIALDQRHVGDVVAAHLVETLGDLEQAVVHVEPGMAPQARIDGGRRGLLVEEAVVAQAPHHAALRVLDLEVRQRAQQPAPGVLEVLRVAERQRGQHRAVVGPRDRRGVVGLPRAQSVSER